MAKTKSMAAVDVICTQFVRDVDGYKTIIAEYPKTFPVDLWDRIRKMKFGDKEFRLADKKEIPGNYATVGASPVINPVELKFVPKMRSELTIMNKQSLIEYCVLKHKTDPKLYEGMKKEKLIEEAEK